MLITGEQLRQPAVGIVDAGDILVYGLEILQAAQQRPIAVGVVNIAPLFDMPAAGDGESLAEVGQILFVAHITCVDGGGHSWGQPAVVAHIERATGGGAVVVGVSIVGQDLTGEVAFLVFPEKAELAPKHQPPFAHQAGGDGRVVIRCEVQVVGDGELTTATTG